MSHFCEIPARPRKPYGKRLRLCFVPPFHPPEAIARVSDRHTWLRSRQVLFDKGEWRLRHSFSAAGTESDLGDLRRRQLTPDPMACRQKEPGAGASDLPL